MSDITASERRLSAALDRLDLLLDATPRPAAADPRQIEALTLQLQEAEAQNARLSRDLDMARQDAARPEQGADLADLQARIEAASEQAARLAAANEDLVAANRNLIEAQATGGVGVDEVRDALEAEIQALRAARAAEMAQMSEIMAELERLLAEDAPLAEQPVSDPEPAEVPAEIGGDASGLPEGDDGGQQTRSGGF
nr:hypothetical protein [Paracoccus saliphilus]